MHDTEHVFFNLNMQVHSGYGSFNEHDCGLNINWRDDQKKHVADKADSSSISVAWQNGPYKKSAIRLSTPTI